MRIEWGNSGWVGTQQCLLQEPHFLPLLPSLRLLLDFLLSAKQYVLENLNNA